MKIALFYYCSTSSTRKKDLVFGRRVGLWEHLEKKKEKEKFGKVQIKLDSRGCIRKSCLQARLALAFLVWTHSVIPCLTSRGHKLIRMGKKERS